MRCLPPRLFSKTTGESEVNDDLPIIQCQPGPTDAELQAERDAKYAQDLAEFEREERYLAEEAELDEFRFDHVPAWRVRG